MDSMGIFRGKALGPLGCTARVTPGPGQDVTASRAVDKVDCRLQKPPWCATQARLQRDGLKTGSCELDPQGSALCLRLASPRAQLSSGFPDGSEASRVTTAGRACICLWKVCACVCTCAVCMCVCAHACEDVCGVCS